MRTLQFDPLSRQFDITYSALVQSPLPLNGSTERKLQGELLDRLEGIGQLKPALDGLGNPREHKRDELQLFECVGGGSIAVSDPEYDLLKRHIVATVDSANFPKAWSRDGQRCVDWIEGVKPDAVVSGTEATA
jgi:hypothetical protein